MQRRDSTSSRTARIMELRRRIRRPPSHRLLVAFFIATLLLVLMANGLATHTDGRASTNDAAADAPLTGSQPLLTKSGNGLRSDQRKPGRRIALTFDDGPDAKWTPLIAARLRRLRVPATFFVMGSHVAREPEVVRRLHEQGFELGNHTFNHTDLSSAPAWQRSLQLSLTDTAIAGATGVRPRVMRPPYSSNVLAVTPRENRALGEVAGRGYVIALSQLDTRDWSRPGVAKIVRAATPRGQRGGVVLMHDGGGNRGQTLAALDQLVPELRKRGFRFVSISGLAGVPRSSVELPASRWEQLRGQALIGALAVARSLTSFFTVLLVALGLLTVARLLLTVLFARRHVAAARRRERPADFTPPLSVVVPAYNEALDIEQAVRSLDACDYPDFELIVVDDGSTDDTAAIVEGLGLERVRLVTQENAGKPAALNRGCRLASHELIVMVDADTVFERETLRRLVIPLEDPRVGAVSGNTKVANRTGLLGRWQHIEYVMGFNLDRRMFEVLQCMPTVPGAIGAFRREALDQVGGMSGQTLAEDTDVTLAIGRKGWRVVHADDARAWTDAPPTFGDLWRQRYRWAYGTLQSAWKHRAAMWRRGEGKIGRRALPYLVLFQFLLPLMSPLVDVLAIYGLLFFNPLVVAAYWLGFGALQMATAVYGFRLDGESLKPLWALPLQQLVYRQIMYLVLIESLISALRGLRIGWQRVRRTGHFDVAPTQSG